MEIERKVSYKIGRRFEGEAKGIDVALNKYLDSELAKRVDNIPTRTREKFELIIEEKVLRLLNEKTQGELGKMFSSWGGPSKKDVITYLEEVIHKNLNKSLNSHIESIGSAYIKKLGVLNIEDVENQIGDLEDHLQDTQKRAYEAGQMDAMR